MENKVIRPMDGWNNRWTDIPLYKDAIHATKNDDFPTDFAIFTKPLRTNRQTDQPTDRPTDGHTLLWRCDSRI